MTNDPTGDEVSLVDTRRAAALLLAFIDGDRPGLVLHMAEAGNGGLPNLILALLQLIKKTAPAVVAEASRPFYESCVLATYDDE